MMNLFIKLLDMKSDFTLTLGCLNPALKSLTWATTRNKPSMTNWIFFYLSQGGLRALIWIIPRHNTILAFQQFSFLTRKSSLVRLSFNLVFNNLQNAPHTQEVVTADLWDRPYSREVVAFPAVSTERLIVTTLPSCHAAFRSPHLTPTWSLHDFSRF